MISPSNILAIAVLLPGLVGGLAGLRSPDQNGQAGAAGDAKVSLDVQVPVGGGMQPAKLTEIHLMDADPETILEGAALQPVPPWELLDSYGMGVITRAGSAAEKRLYKQKYQAFHVAATDAIRPHIAMTATTDAAGKVEFVALRPGTYYVLGVAKIDKGISIIRAQIEVKSGANKFSL